MNRALLFLVLILLVLRAAGVERYRVTSYKRTAAKNAEVGGVPNSLHQVGLAIDIVALDGFDAALLRAAELWRSLGLDAVDEGDHIHFELDGPGITA